jgi:dCMP deaminase
MSIAIMSAQRSKDPNTQVGACIVDADNRILSVGYNGMPTGCDDDSMPWNRDGDGLESKYFFVCHAELNAILNYRGNSNLKGARVYVTLFPCNECAKAIIQSGISEIIYMQDKYSDAETTIASKRMFDMAGVKYTPYENRHKKIEFEV